MEIYATYDNPFVAVVRSSSHRKSEGQLSFFDLSARRRIGSFPIIYSGGLRRCSLSNDTRRCFVGCFQDHGLAAYSTRDGVEIWRRKDLQILNGVTAFTHEDVVFCMRDEEAFLLCARTGHTLDIIQGIGSIYISPFNRNVLVGARGLEIHSSFGKQIGTISRTTFAELDCAFSESEVLITESGGPVRCFDLNSAQLLWTHTPPEGSHFLNLCYSGPLNCFVGVWFYYKESNDHSHRIFHFVWNPVHVMDFVWQEQLCFR